MDENDYVGPWWADILAANLQLEVELSDVSFGLDMPFADDPRITAVVCKDAHGVEHLKPGCYAGPDLVGQDKSDEGEQTFRCLTVCMGRPVIDTDVVCFSLNDSPSPRGQRHPSCWRAVSDLPCTVVQTGLVGCLHRCPHPFPLHFPFGDTSKAALNLFLRQLSKGVGPIPTTLATGGSLPVSIDALSQRVRPVACTAPCPLAAQLSPVVCEAIVRPATGAGRPATSGLTDLRLRLSAQVTLYPEELDRPELRAMQVSQFWWFSGYRTSGGTCESPQQDRFALFTTSAHVEVRQMRRGMTLGALVAEVYSLVPGLRSLRVLLERVAGFPAVQLAATTREAAEQAHATPIDLRSVGGRVCTLNLLAGSTANEVALEVMTACPENRRPQGPFRLQLPDGRNFVAVPYQVLGPDYIQGRAPLDVAPHAPDARDEVAEEDDTALMQTGLALCMPMVPHKAHIPSLESRVVLSPWHADTARCQDDSVRGAEDQDSALFAVRDSDACFVAVPDGEPPTLLRMEGPPRASVIHYTAKVPTILPERLAAPNLREIPAGQLCLFCQAPAHRNELRRYSVFDRNRHHAVRKASVHWSLLDYIVDATSSASEDTQSVQVLTLPIADLPEPQLTITPIGLPPGALVIPLDARAIGGPLCALPLAPGLDFRRVLDAFAMAAPSTVPLLEQAMHLDGVFLQDPTGRIWETLPMDLSEVQWLKVVLEPRLQQQLGWLMTLDRPTTLTSTAVLTTAQASSPTETVSFVLAGGGTVIRLAPQPIRQASVRQSLCELVFILGLQGRVPNRPVVSLASAAPRQAAQPANRIVIFLVYPASDIGDICHILQDYSLDGSLLQEMSVDCDVVAGHLISEAHRRRGYLASLNGIPHTAAGRTLITGDLIQVEQAPPSARVTPIDALYDILPDLRFFSMPMRVPSLHQLMRDPAAGLGRQEIIKDAMQRSLDSRILERRVEIGEPGHNCQAILVLGPEHPPLLLYMPSNVEPSLAEATTFLAWSGFFEPGTTFVDPQVYAHTFPVFVSVPKGSQRATILFPAPHTLLHWLQLNVPIGMPLQGFGLPVRRNFELVLPAQTMHGAVIRERLIRGRASSPEPEGTSLLQIQLSVSQNRAAGDCKADPVPPFRHAPATSIPTPFGRRQLQAARSAVGCNSLCQGPTRNDVLLQGGGQSVTQRRQIALADLLEEPQVEDHGRVESDCGTTANVVHEYREGHPPCPDSLGIASADTVRRTNVTAARLASPTAGPASPGTGTGYFGGAQPEASLHFPVPAELPGLVFGHFKLEDFATQMPEGIRLHPAAAALLEHMPLWDRNAAPEALMLYVDGSFKLGQAAWAVSGFALIRGFWFWTGFLAAQLDSRFMAGSAYEAELMAQLVAHCVAAQSDCTTAIFYDSTAAVGAAEGRTSLKTPHVLGRALASVSAFLLSQGRPPRTCHVASHTGNPANELVDSLAKNSLQCTAQMHTDAVAPLNDSILAGDLDWLWIRASPDSALPIVDEHGDTTPLCRLEEPVVLKKPADFAPSQTTSESKPISCPLRLVTYNVLSAKSALQRQCLHKAFKRGKFSVLALQETKFTEAPHKVYDGVLRLAGPCCNGEEGVALWFDVASPELPWGRAHIATTFANERLLTAVVSLPGLKLMFLTGHAYPATASADKIDSFWELVRARLLAMPPDAAPVLLLDANARFEEVASGLAPVNRNAEHWLGVLADFSLWQTGVRDSQSELLCTWTSPGGQPACLDYAALPSVWAASVSRVLTTDILDEFAGIDHTPLLVDVNILLLPNPKGGMAYDVEAMHTQHGRSVIADIMSLAPKISWATGVDAHVCQLNRYFQDQMRLHFPAQKQRPRHPALSADTWRLLQAKRNLRRSQRFRSRWVARQCLADIFAAWRSCSGRVAGPGLDRIRARQKTADLQASHYGVVMRRLQLKIRASFQADIASFTRQMWREVRQGGPAELARHLRAVLKAGRSYKPPRAAVALNHSGRMLTDPQDVAMLFGRTFAVAEHAQEVDFQTMQADPRADMVTARFLAEQVPPVATLAASFASLKPRRAAGLSRIPPDFYAAAPVGSAIVHSPVVLKLLVRNKAPVLWGGCLSRPLLKPGKAPDDPKSYRAIALQEPAAKAVSKALRPHLCERFESIAMQGVGGARPAFALTIPALTVQAAMSCAHSAKRSISVLFIDGVAAFYATSRESLFRQDRATLEQQLRSGPCSEEVIAAFLAFLPEVGALEAAGVNTATVAALQATLSGTWYTTLPEAKEVFSTEKGTVPGAPLADLLFQYVLQAAILTLDFMLRRSGIAMCVRAQGNEVHAEPCSWLDDLTLLIQAGEAQDLAEATSQAAMLAHQCLHLIGIELNYAANKTEALMIWKGKGSRGARERTLVRDAGLLDIGCFDGKHHYLRCTDEYTHLGSVRASSANAAADLKRRAQLARTIFQPLRARLLRNTELSIRERCHLLFSTALASYTHGLGTWSLSQAGEWQQFRKEYMKFLRGSVRPLFAVPCKRLDEMQVCALLNALTPVEAFTVCQVRAFSQLVAKGSDFVRAALQLEGVWLHAVREAILRVRAVLKVPALDVFSDVPLAGLWTAWTFDAAGTAGLLRRYRKACVHQRADVATTALAKARLHHKLDGMACTFVKLEETRPLQRSSGCEDCGQLFSTPAACAAHRRAVHGKRSLASYGFGSACQVCQKQFWTPAKLRDHLRRSHHCAQVFANSDIVEPETPALHPLSCSMPVVDLIGPRPWWATLHPDPGRDVPPARDCALDCRAIFDRFRTGPDLHAFFVQRAKAAELYGVEELQAYFESQSEGGPLWLLANQVAAAICKGATGVYIQPPLAALVRSGFLLFGPSATIEIASGWDLSLL